MSALDWIREVILVVLLGWVLEMLVFSEEYRRYVRLVIGLLVLVAVIRPALVFLGSPTLPIPKGMGTDAAVAGLVAQGIAMNQSDQAAAMTLYASDVGREAAAVALTVPGVQGAKGTASVETDPNSPAYGEVLGITVYVTPGQPGQIQPIQVGGDGGGGKLPARLAKEVQSAISRGLQVEASAIRVLSQGGSQ